MDIFMQFTRRSNHLSILDFEITIVIEHSMREASLEPKRGK